MILFSLNRNKYKLINNIPNMIAYPLLINRTLLYQWYGNWRIEFHFLKETQQIYPLTYIKFVIWAIDVDIL